jgi:hypothetical protein
MNAQQGNLEEIGERDHEITAEYRIFGPPGTGKTTSLARGRSNAPSSGSGRTPCWSRRSRAPPPRNCRAAIFRCRPTASGHCTRTAGTRWAGRRSPRRTSTSGTANIRTSRITPARKQGKLDGEEAPADEIESEKSGDESLQELNRFRGMMPTAATAWAPRPLIAFEKLWTNTSRKTGCSTFTDLIECCLRDVALAPRSPSVIFADEAQDLNRMQLSLVRKWGERARLFHRGRRRRPDHLHIHRRGCRRPSSTPEVPPDHKIILKQSYRVPRAVHRFAEDLIGQVNAGSRRNTCRARRTARSTGSRATAICTPSTRSSRPRRAPRAGTDRDVPGVVRVYAAQPR